MKAFIKYQDEKAWHAVMFAWKHPTFEDDNENIILKSEDCYKSKFL